MNPVENYFSLEDALVARLSAIPGLQVKTTADASEATMRAVTRPTAVVAFSGDEVTDSNPFALQVEQKWAVFLVCRGAVKERSEADGRLLLQIVQALHGWDPGGELEPLAFRGVESDYIDNARQYLALFVTRGVVRVA